MSRTHIAPHSSIADSPTKGRQRSKMSPRFLSTSSRLSASLASVASSQRSKVPKPAGRLPQFLPVTGQNIPHIQTWLSSGSHRGILAGGILKTCLTILPKGSSGTGWVQHR